MSDDARAATPAGDADASATDASDTEVVAVDVDRRTGVTITWDDGLVARFALDELRAACPCAGCRGERERPRNLLRITPVEAEQLRDAELVGAWGISFRWADGHEAGIYPWDALRAWALDARDADG